MESIWKAEENWKCKSIKENLNTGNNKDDKNIKYESSTLNSVKNGFMPKDKNQSAALSAMKKNGDCLPRLADKRQWDVIVIGAGMAGILTAWYLQQEGKQVLVLEAKEAASGQTQNTTAKITSQHGMKYQQLIRTVGRKKAQLYAQANEQAISEYEKLIQRQKIDCDFERQPAYLYSKEKEEVLRKEAQAAASLGIRAKFMEESELCVDKNDAEESEIVSLYNKIDLSDKTFLKNTEEDSLVSSPGSKETKQNWAGYEEIVKKLHIRSAVCFDNQAQFSPLKFVQALAKELNILEHMEVLTVKGHRLIARESNEWSMEKNRKNAWETETRSVENNTETAKEKIFSADKIVMATHYPFKNFPGFYFLRQHQERSYVLALTDCQPLYGMYYGIDQNSLSLRQAGEYLLVGGSAHRTGKNKSGGAYDFLENAAVHYFPEGSVAARWSAQDCMPHDGIPFIGKFSIFTPHLYVATGFQKWGMTTSMVAALLLKDEICGYENPYKNLFRPQRLHIRASAVKLIIDVWVSICGLTKGFLRIFNRKAPRCPHMGCALTWNPDEKSWDCPCHGSRFEENGKLLDNPAQRNL